MRIADYGVRIGFGGKLEFLSGVMAQDVPTPEISPSPPATPTSTASISPTPTPAPARNVRISFVPPPLDGNISLGIYDLTGKLVRVLHRQVPMEVFTIGADALQTKWDGKDDVGVDLPSGKYHARGYTVGMVRLENISDPEKTPPPASGDKITVKLVANPLVKNDRPNVDLTVGFDDTDSFLKTTDALPLYVINERNDITAVTFTKAGEKSMDVWQISGAGTEHFRLSNLDQMMAFDCGVFDLK